MNNSIKVTMFLLAVPLVVSLSSCYSPKESAGSGGGLPAFDVTVSVAEKRLNFSWPQGNSYNHYRLLVNLDGNSGFAPVQGAENIAGDSTGISIKIPVHKINWSSVQYRLEGCDALEAQCIGSSNLTLNVADSIDGILYVKASNPGASDFFGHSVAIDDAGTTFAIGAPFEESGSAGIDGDQLDDAVSNAGAVYVFVKTGATWTQQAYIKSSAPVAEDRFGIDVDLSADGNTLVVGAFGHAGDEGAAYVFIRAGNAWSEQAILKASNSGAGDFFGQALSLSGDGNSLAIGAKNEDSSNTGINPLSNELAVDSGAAYIFTRSGSVWAQRAFIKASNTDAGDQFGQFVSLSDDGNYLAVGAIQERSASQGINGDQNNNLSVSSGAVYVYSRGAGGWTQQAYIKSSNNEAGDLFGGEVALDSDGSTLVVGAALEDSNASGVNGQQGNNSASASGAAYVFERSLDTWTQVAYIKPSNPRGNLQFGVYSMALSRDGSTLAIGSQIETGTGRGVGADQLSSDGGFNGALYIYSFDGANWSFTNYVKASNTGFNDNFARDIGLTADGDMMIVGAAQEKSSASGLGGDQLNDSLDNAGAAYIY